MLADPGVFRGGPIAPLTDLYAAAGLVERDGTIAEPTFDWDALDAWRNRNHFLRSYGLDPSRSDQAEALVAAFEAWTDGGGESATPVTTVDALDDGAVAHAVWADLEQTGAGAEQLVAFLGTLRYSDPASIGAVWVRARALDRSGEAVAAAGALEAVVEGDDRHGPALIDLAGYRADRGDAVGALRLLDRAGFGPADDHDHDHERSDPELLWDEVEPYATHRPRATARRNDPCPCGSGRKYKVCHLGRETHTLEDRARWLYLKADRFLRDRHPDVVAELAPGWSTRANSPTSSTLSSRARSSPTSSSTRTACSPSSSPPATGSCPLTKPCSAPSGRWPTAACSRSSRSSTTPSSCAT